MTVTVRSDDMPAVLQVGDVVPAQVVSRHEIPLRAENFLKVFPDEALVDVCRYVPVAQVSEVALFQRIEPVIRQISFSVVRVIINIEFVAERPSKLSALRRFEEPLLVN